MVIIIAELTHGDVYSVRVRSQFLRCRLLYATVQEKWRRIAVIKSMQNVGAKQVALMSGEVVIQCQTALHLER